MPQFTPEDVKYDLENLRHDIFLEETEESWDKIAAGIKAFTKICEEGGYETSTAEIVNALRNFHRPMISAMNSERTRLSAVPLDLLNSVAANIGSDFEPLLSVFLPALLALCGRTNKVVISRAKAVIMTIIENCQLAGVLPYFVNNIKDKSTSLRLIIADGTLAVLNSCNPPDLEKETRAKEIEAIIKGTARDANADIRKVSRKIFESYKILLPQRVESFIAPLTPTMKKYLDVKPSATLATAKSTANLRSQFNLNPEPTQSTSNTNTTSTAPSRPAGHTRTTSTSILPASSTTSSNPIRNLATTLTRVARNPPPSTNATGPIRPVQASRVVSETVASGSRPPRSDVAPARPASVQEKRPVPPIRSTVNTTKATSSSAAGAANRIQIISKPAPAAGSSSATSSGPRRIAMPPPPPPAPKKEKDGPQRPASRAEGTAHSTTAQVSRLAAPPVKKTTSTLSSSLKDRLALKEKEREAEKAKVSDRAKEKQKAKVVPEPSMSTSATTRPAKTTMKPPVPKAREAVTAASSSRSTTTRSTSNTMGPPANPTAAAVKAKPQWGGRSATVKPVPPLVSKAGTKPVVKKPVSRLPIGSRPASQASRRAGTPAMVALPPSPEPTEAPVQTPVVEEVVATPPPAVYPQDPVIQPEQEETVDEDETPQVEEQRHEEQDAEVESSPVEDEVPEENDEETEEQPIPEMGAADPKTPQTYLAPPPPSFALKTPISSLLASIENGFLYSPSDPVSPADTYLLDNGPHVKQVHNGPMQAFNYALHPSTDSPYGTRNEEMLQHADIGIMKVDPSRPYLPSSLMLDPERKAFYEINQ